MVYTGASTVGFLSGKSHLCGICQGKLFVMTDDLESLLRLAGHEAVNELVLALRCQ